jgi:hypothetical protein
VLGLCQSMLMAMVLSANAAYRNRPSTSEIHVSHCLL